MSKKKKIKKTDIPKDTSSAIKPTKLKLQQGISFSFKYYQDSHEKFSVNGKKTSYWLTFLERLKALSGLTVQEFLSNHSKTLRCHSIKWEDTSENCFGLQNEEQLVDIALRFRVRTFFYPLSTVNRQPSTTKTS